MLISLQSEPEKQNSFNRKWPELIEEKKKRNQHRMTTGKVRGRLNKDW
jgi:hypothetical protein